MKKYIFSSFLFLFLTAHLNGQISGPTTVCPGETTTYSIPNDPCYSIVGWGVSGDGVIIGPSNGFSVTVLWLSAGPAGLCVTYDDLCTGQPSEFCANIDIVDIPPTYIEEDICVGECIEIGGMEFCTPGVVTVALTSSQGCDSSVIATINLIPTPVIDLDTLLIPCDTTLEICGQEITDTGVYFITCQEVGACDTIYSFVAVEDTVIANVELSPYCYQFIDTLDGRGSSTGIDYSYKWTSNLPLPNTINNDTALMIEVSHWAEGWYYLTVTHELTGCKAVDSILYEYEPLVDFVYVDIDSVSFECGQSEITLNAVPSANIDLNVTSIFWFSMDGNIVSGGSTLNPVVDQSGKYFVGLSGSPQCTAIDSIILEKKAIDITFDPATLDCGQSEVTLNANVTPASGTYEFTWIANPGNFVSGTNTFSPVVDTIGTYCIHVIDWVTGCEGEACVDVTDSGAGNVIAEAGPSFTLDCSGNVIELDGTDSSTGANIIYEWTAATCCIEDGADTMTPLVYQQGWYYLKVTDTSTGCMATDSVYVNGIEIYIEPAIFSCGASDIILQAEVEYPNLNFPPYYFWSTSDGVILSGNDDLDPVIGSPGTYCLTAVTPGQYCFQEKCINVESEPNCSTVSGNVLVDGNMNCQTDVGEMPLSGWLVQAEGANGVFYGTTDADGFYSITVLPGVVYTITLTTANNAYFICNNDVVTNVIDNNNNGIVNFSVGEVLPCPILNVDLSNNLLRRCADNNFFYVNYCNEGTETANAAYVEITLDPALTLVYSPNSYTSLGNNVYNFAIGDLVPDQCGGFWFKAFLDCDVEIAETHCSEAHIFPDDACFPSNPLWSGASLEVKASCTDSTRFTVTNIGSAALTIPAGYVVIEDAVMYRPGEISALQPGESVDITMPANGSTWRLELEQEPFHPFPNVPVAWVEGCGTNSSNTFSKGFVNQQFLGDPELYLDTDCTMNQGPYDPNDKQGFPLGYDEEHFIKKDNQIEYMIRFQNTGNDTAFNVVLLDTLDHKLDFTSLRPGASSHSYDWEIYGTGILKFTFNDILLPDSTTDLIGSQGFVQFVVSPKEDILPNEVIRNSADIYFDFNAPITTNTTIHTIEKPKVHEVKEMAICMGDYFNGALIEGDTMIVETISFPLYDSLNWTLIQALPKVAATVSAVICDGDSYLFNGNQLTQKGTYQAAFTAFNGCDSTVTLTLGVLDAFETTMSAEICQGAAYDFYGETLNAAGQYEHLLQTSSGCDSLVKLDLTISDSIISKLSAQICEGETYDLNGEILTTAGTYESHLQTAVGCDSLVRLELDVATTYEITEFAEICEGEEFHFNGQILTATGNYEAKLSSLAGCDSIVFLNLLVHDKYSTPSSASICDGDSYWFNGQELTVEGTYEAMLSSVNGCDSLLTLALTVLEKDTSTTTASICEGSEYDFHGEILMVAGEYETILTNMNGCDSSVHLSLEVTDALVENISAQICPNETYVFGNEILTEPGIYELDTVSMAGCDSTALLTLEYYQAYNIERSTVICYGDSAELDGVFYHTTGVYTASYSTINGCDSISVLDLTVSDSLGSEFSTTICENEVFDFNGEMLNEEGVYETVYETLEGCDSTVTLILDIEPTYTDTLEKYVVHGEMYMGVPIVSDTVFIENLLAENGCDSIVTTFVFPVMSTNENLTDAIDLSIYPNPTDDRFFVKFELNATQSAQLNVRNMIGQQTVFASQNNSLSVGQHIFEIPVQEWPSGVYLIQFQLADGIATSKIVID